MRPNPLLTELKTATEAGRLRYTDMRRFAIALVALTACTSQSTAHPATTASTSRTASPARAASPAPVQVARVDFSCQLPIYSPDRQGAFVHSPGQLAGLLADFDLSSDQWSEGQA